MNKKTARKIADALTWSRVISVVPITLLAWLGLRWWVLAVYIAAALTDFLDGFFARRAAPPSSDLDFDGLADVLLTFMTLLWLWLIIPGFLPKYWLPYVPIVVLLEIYMTSARLRYPGLVVPHLEFGRFGMALYFTLLPILIIWHDVPWFVHVVFIIGTAGKIQLTWAVVNRVNAERAESARA